MVFPGHNYQTQPFWKRWDFLHSICMRSWTKNIIKRLFEDSHIFYLRTHIKLSIKFLFHKRLGDMTINCQIKIRLSIGNTHGKYNFSLVKKKDVNILIRIVVLSYQNCWKDLMEWRYFGLWSWGILIFFKLFVDFCVCRRNIFCYSKGLRTLYLMSFLMNK